jgi:cytochrome o ubiquinol oxidase subunit 2
MIRKAVRAACRLSPLGLTACQMSLLDPQGAVGVAEKTLLLDSLAIMLAIVIPTLLATLAFAWWFRASNKRAVHWPTWHYSGQLELLVWAIPLLTIMLLGGVAWVSAHDLDPAKPLASTNQPLNIQVVSLDWKWLFIYPDDHLATLNQLVIPAGVPVHFDLTSSSVMNAFFIPQLGSMIYTMNGMADQLNLIADHPGTYYGRSSHYSGDGFSGMQFETRALSPADFASWVAATRDHGPALTSQSYLALAKQSQNDPPATYGTIEPGLFDKIVTQKLPPGPGPVAQTNPGAPQQAEP